MSKDYSLTYTNNDGREVKTSQFLRNRGSCCRTSCLHCPYGFTLKNNDITYEDVTEMDLELAQVIIEENSGKKEEVSSVAASLMGQAFGSSKKASTIQITKENFHNYAFISIKDVIFGMIEKVQNQTTPQAKALFLREHFKDQEIDIDIINSSL